MPTSDHRQIPVVLDAVVRRQPKRVLDVGVGWGKYGTLIREVVPTVEVIDGIEPWRHYGYELHHDQWWAYDQVVDGAWPDADTIAAATADPDRAYDLVLMIDVLEHMDVGDGITAVYTALDVARCVIVATPHDPMRFPQDDLDNPYERHRYRWTLPMFADLASDKGRVLAEAHHLADSIVVVMER